MLFCFYLKFECYGPPPRGARISAARTTRSDRARARATWVVLMRLSRAWRSGHAHLHNEIYFCGGLVARARAPSLPQSADCAGEWGGGTGRRTRALGANASTINRANDEDEEGARSSVCSKVYKAGSQAASLGSLFRYMQSVYGGLSIALLGRSDICASKNQMGGIWGPL